MSTVSDYETIATALRFLGDRFQEQPSLDRLSAEMGLSKFHLQRLFTRWAGVSPKRFLQFLTVQHAKGLLRDSEPVLAAAFASGLSGPARLHDLFIHTEGVTPGEYKRAGETLEITYGFQTTPFGVGLFAKAGRGLCHLAFLPSDSDGDRRRAMTELTEEWPGADLHEAPGMAAELARVIFHPEGSPPPSTPLSLFLKGTNYQIKVWNALLRIPDGKLTTYGRLAGLMGSPGGARSVGSAVARNHIAYLIPCHRVIREVGTFGEYRWGPERKKAMLGWEAARKDSF
jgi:AraC family transcriptional regulator of adaptative response/methylated-DNA-[protein]-cysteine methyltransferase